MLLKNIFHILYIIYTEDNKVAGIIKTINMNINLI